MRAMPRISYEFGPFCLDAQRHALSRSGQPVSLPPKAFEILLLLLENRDNLLSKTDLLSRIWPNSVVEENNLAQHVSLLRKTLGENRVMPQYIETVPRVGYRFIGEVRVVESGRTSVDIGSISAGEPSRNDIALRPRRRTRWIPIPALLFAAFTIAVLLAFLLWPKPSPAVLDYVQLTHDGFPKHPPLRTDGEFVYFTEMRGGVNTLVRVPSQGGEPVVLSSIPANLQLLDLSPIRHQILAVELGPTGVDHPLWVGALPAGPFYPLPQLLAKTAAWSQAGDRIFYTRDRKLYVASGDGTRSKELVSTPGNAISLHASPDGRFLTFQIQHEIGTSNELWEVRQDGSHLRQVSADVSLEIEHTWNTWTPDSSYFIFGEAGEGKDWLIALKRPLFGVGSGSRIRLNPGLLSATEIVSGANRKKLLAIAALQRMEILRFDSKTGGLMPYLAGISADGLAFSRQGDWVAYTSFPDRRLVRSRLDGTERRDLTDGTRRALLPAWSPDGHYIAYTERAGAGPFKIQLISNEGGAPQMLQPGSDDEANPTWSPDGNSLIYAGAPWIKGFTQNSTAVHRVDLRTRHDITLPGSAGLWSPRWSPDGKYLIAETVDSQRLMLLDFSTQVWTPLVDAHGESLGYTSWSHDSRYVYYNTYLNQRGTIHRVNVARRIDERVPVPENIDMAVTLGQWFTLAPDDSPLFLRDASVREVFALDLGLP